MRAILSIGKLLATISCFFAAFQNTAVGRQSDSGSGGGDSVHGRCAPPNYGYTQEMTRLNNIILSHKFIDITIPGARFKVPYGYVTAHPGPTTVDCRNYWDDFRFSFWWPDKSSTDGTGDENFFNKSNKSSPKSSPHRSIVHVGRIKYVDINEKNPKLVLPRQQMENIERYVSHLKYSDHEIYGLREYKSEIPGYQFIYYETPTSLRIDFDMVLKCRSKTAEWKCQGSAYLPTEKLTFDIDFLDELFPDAVKILSHCRDSLKSWRISDGD
ncbi:MAG: hypothetical protein WAP03_16680 [Methylorubrum rhodinum]|uniref:hypothetical protein n=1 Tax=Methylorubrum rhodinum TaxID=29428 RepID=UPI003BB04A13